MRNTFLVFSPPALGQEEIDEAVDSLRTGWITTGPKVKRFEEEFANFVGAPSALGLNSGMRDPDCLSMGPGDAAI